MFRRKVCFHDWKLIDTGISYINLGCEVDAVYKYCMGCSKCNKTKWMDENEYKHFIMAFGG